MQIMFGNPNIKTDSGLNRGIDGIIRSGWVSIGEYVEALESHFKDKFHMKHAIATSSATTGLIIAIKAAGWQEVEVALPAFTWPSTLYALMCNGNEPIFYDIDEDTWLVEQGKVYTGNLLAVDTFGNQFDKCDRYMKKNTIVDAAHGYGLPNLGKRGIAEVVSLSFTKVVTAMEGGMILTDDDNLAGIARELRRLSGRMSEINALVALRSIENYDENHEVSWDNIMNYTQNIKVPYRSQEIVSATNHSVFSVAFEDPAVRNAIVVALAKAGVETKIYYDPLKEGLSNTDYLYRRILSLPTHEGVTPHMEEIVGIINTAGLGAKTPGKEFLTQ